MEIKVEDEFIAIEIDHSITILEFLPNPPAKKVTRKMVLVLYYRNGHSDYGEMDLERIKDNLTNPDLYEWVSNSQQTAIF